MKFPNKNKTTLCLVGRQYISVTESIDRLRELVTYVKKMNDIPFIKLHKDDDGIKTILVNINCILFMQSLEPEKENT